MDKEQRAQTSIKRKRQQIKKANYCPPDKSEHFAGSDDDDFSIHDLPKPKKKRKLTNKRPANLRL